jgi:molybdopterin converting factor subunit 1
MSQEGPRPQRTIRVVYYAILREQAGRHDETLRTGACTPAELYGELSARHGFSLGTAQLRAAINGDFASFDSALAEGDEVVFIPPVAGGAR